MLVAVSSIIEGTMILIGMINGAFNIHIIKHIIFWIIAIIGAVITCILNGMVFDLFMNYLAIRKFNQANI